MAGRKPAKDYAALYPGWPDIDPKTVTDPLDHRVLQLFHLVRDDFEARMKRGEIKSTKEYSRFLELPSALVHNLLHGKTIPTVETIVRIENKVHHSMFPPYDNSLMHEVHEQESRVNTKNSQQ